MTAANVNVLLVEDSNLVRKRVTMLLEEDTAATFLITPVGTLADATMALGQIGFDVIVLDLGLPDSEGLETLAGIMNTNSELPVVILTGLNDDETAMEALHRGAQDYLAKDLVRHPTVLSRALRYAIERKKLNQKLADTLAHVKTLHGMLPICSHCKRIRDDEGYWEQIEGYLSRNSDVDFTHSMCEECAEKHHPEFYARYQEEQKAEKKAEKSDADES